MRTLILSTLFCLVTGFVFSQNLDSTTTVTVSDSSDHNFTKKWERLFSGISMDSIKTGFFLDRAVNWISPTKHQGIVGSDGTLDDSCYFETIFTMHQSFKLAQVDTGTHTLFDSTELLEAKVKQYTDAGKIPIVAMYMKYDHIRDSAFADSLLYFDQSDTSIHDVTNGLTTFKRFTSPVAPTNGVWNERHASFTLQHGSLFKDEMIDYLKQLTVSNLYNDQFNFGVYKQYNDYWNYPHYITSDRLQTVTVSGTAKIKINANDRVALYSNNLPNVNQTKDFNVYTQDGQCGKPSIVTFNSGGELQIGDAYLPEMNGILHITDGSTLNLNNGSTLTINNNSKLIIESGATLNINGTPTINLNGNIAVIEIQDGAVLNIPTGASLTNFGSGFFKLYGGDGTQTIITGGGAINLLGSGKNNKVIEFASSSKGNVLHIANTIQSFNVTDGKILNDCKISFLMPVSINNGNLFNYRTIDFLNSLWANNSTFSGVNNCYDNMDIDLCSLYGPLSAVAINYPKHVNITRSTFTYADNGNGALNLYGTNDVVLEFLNFVDNGIGLNAQYITGRTTCQQCKFYHTENNYAMKGVTFSGSTGSSLYLDRTDITNMQLSGVEIEGGELFANCGKIVRTNNIDPSVGVRLNTGAVLTIDQLKSGGVTVGNMDFSGHINTINATDAEMINIDNGYSNLNNLLPNEFDGNALLGHITNKVIQLDAQYNYWNTGKAPTRNNYYTWFFDGNGLFDETTTHSINGNNFFQTPLDIEAACPSRNTITIGGGGGGGSFGKTSNVHSTKFIDSLSNVPYKNGQNLKQAMQHIYSYSNDTTDSGLNDQIDYYEQVLKHNFGTHKSKAAPALSSAYRKMNQGISVGLKHGIIQHHSTSPQLNKLIHIQDTLLNRTTASDSINKYKLITDKALTLRLANRRMDAMPLLNQAHNLANINGKKYIEKWQCFIDKEMRLQNGSITKQQFLAEIKLCGAPDTTMSKRSQYDYVTTENEVVAKSDPLLDVANKTEVLLYPNPALDNLNIEIKNLSKESTINILVFDIVGRIMYTGSQHANEKNAVLNIPVNLSSGTYFVKLEGENINETKRFSVLK